VGWYGTLEERLCFSGDQLIPWGGLKGVFDKSSGKGEHEGAVVLSTSRMRELAKVDTGGEP
jgi:hypothetical protein